MDTRLDVTLAGGKKAAKTDDLDFDEDLKDLDLFSEERFDDDEEDDS